MSTSAPIPAPDPSMASPSDTASEALPSHASAQAHAATSVRPSLRVQVAENPLLSFFGLLIVALLAAAVASPNIRINDTNRRIDRLEDNMDARFDKVKDDMDARFDKVDARFGEVDARFDEVDARFDEIETAVGAIDLKLTALIAHLNATSAVDHGLTGRLTGDGTDGRGGP